MSKFFNFKADDTTHDIVSQVWRNSTDIFLSKFCLGICFKQDLMIIMSTLPEIVNNL